MDQAWANDVTACARDGLGWDGEKVNLPPGPYVGNEFTDIIIENAPSHGVKVDIQQPTFPWVDLLGEIRIDIDNAANRPTMEIYRGNIKQCRMKVNDNVGNNFHMPHDYVPGSDIFIHTHWSVNVVDAGSTTWAFEVSYAKGHQQMEFSAPITRTVAQSAIGQYTHMIAEVQLSSPGGVGGMLDSNLLEIDGIILVRTYLQSKTITSLPFLHYVDIHYQSTGIGTKNKAPNFYG